MNQKHLGLACIIIASLLSCNQAQQCSSNQFSVKNNGVDYLTINSPTEVKTCGGINICDEITKGKQSLTLGTNGELSISNGNSVQIPSPTLSLSSSGEISLGSGNSIELPDASSTNEIQSLSLAGDQLSLSSSNSVQLPDGSATNELQNLSVTPDGELSISNGNAVTLPRPVNDMISLSINQTTDSPNNVPLNLDFVEGTSIEFVAPYTIRFKEAGTYHVSMAPAGVSKGGWFCVQLKCTLINHNILSICDAIASDTAIASGVSRIVRLAAGETCVWWVMYGEVMIPENWRMDWVGISILRLK